MRKLSRMSLRFIRATHLLQPEKRLEMEPFKAVKPQYRSGAEMWV